MNQNRQDYLRQLAVFIVCSLPKEDLLKSEDKMKKSLLTLIEIIILASVFIGKVYAEVSVTAANTGELAGNWAGKKWNYVSGHVLWREQNDSAVHVSCTAVLDCALAVGTVNDGKFYPRYGFVTVGRGATWEDAYSIWRYQHGTEIAFKYPEPVARLSANGICTLIGLYWGTDEDGGYQNWLPVPGSHCAPISRS
ncbi:hypothetical protein SOD10_39310 [Serratia plymuthica]|nr:hypothetical protein [Serratia plymuthica]ANS41602.1 hypothetical protein Q5A_005600 [Serratia inhibens PRI-2C]KYG14956.1 hypothetical protein SOD10_39310 [Serratia plymuthica]QPS89677.1 hypothetical protein I6G46_12375 [Serratia plymuthica]